MQVAGRGIWLILLTFLIACGGDVKDPIELPLRSDNQKEKNELRKQIKIIRFDQDLQSLTKEGFSEDTTEMYRNYGSFPDLFFSRIINVGNKKFPLFKENVLGFTNDPDIKNIFKEVNRQYPDLNKENEDLSIAFTRFTKIFPDTIVPQVFAMISGFNYNIAVSDSALAIGLDMYLGDSCRFYEWLALPDYKRIRMNRQFLSTDAIRGFLSATFENQNKDHDLISSMIYEGKIMYLTESLLPHFQLSSILGYSGQQLAWCDENEGKIWSFFIDKKLFYSNDFNNEVAFINDGPFTKGFPKDSPARIGVWLGYKIVKSYMNKNQQISIPELMRDIDSHGIFNRSGYKPVRA